MLYPIFLTVVVTLAMSLFFHLRFLRQGHGDDDLPTKEKESDSTYWPLVVTFSLVWGAVAGELVHRWPVTFGPVNYLGVVMLLAARFWLGWAYKALGEHYRPTATNTDPGQKLVTAGPYRYTRHPIYLGNVLVAAGLLTALDARWSWLSMATYLPVLLWRIQVENRFLKRKFDEPGHEG